MRVAAILNLTGPAAQFDAVKKQTIELAVTRVKQLNPALRIEMQTFDAGDSPETTRVAVRRALAWNAGYFLSGTSPTALEIASQLRGHHPDLVQIANAANPDFGPPRPAEYRFWPDWKQEVDVILGVLQEQRMKSVLLIHSADPYSRSADR